MNSTPPVVIVNAEKEPNIGQMLGGSAVCMVLMLTSGVTGPLLDTLFHEMKGRIKEDDSSIPMKDGPFAYGSAFVTGGLTALLALVLETPDLGTALLVFLIIGIGAAGAAVFAKRRYGWWLAAASWTAALWCVWGLVGITDVEPYVYPPALAAVVIGVVLTVRGRNGAVLVAPGLAIAIATSLVVLAVTGSGGDAVLPWRALALLAASLLLLALGALLTRRGGRLAALRVPVLAASTGAAATFVGGGATGGVATGAGFVGAG